MGSELELTIFIFRWKILQVYLEEIDRISNERMETTVAAMKKQQGITEELKARDHLAWVGAMNNIRNAAEEIICAEVIYA